MATNRASLSDTYVMTPPAAMRHAERTDAPDPAATRRTLMVAGGFVLALVSLAAAAVEVEVARPVA